MSLLQGDWASISSLWREQILLFLHNRSRMVKIAALVVLDSFMLTFAVLAAYMLRMSEIALPPHSIILLLLLGPVLSVASAGLFGVYLSITRLRAQGSDTPIILSQAPVVLVWSLFVVVMGEGFPRSVVLIYAIFAPVVMISSRRLIAAVLGDRALFVSERRGVPTVILGAGSVGAELLVSLRGRDDHEIVAFVETDANLVGGYLARKKIVALTDLPDLIEFTGVREVFVAKKNFSRADHRKLVEFLHPYPVTLKVVPGLDEVASGKISFSAARAVRVEDLLGRDPVRPRGTLMSKAVSKKSVLVTGAGGSIGSEIVRQVERYKPAKLILVDNNEFALFEIHREIEARMSVCGSDMELKAILGSVVDSGFLLDVMTQHGVEVVFHAAAYKHVRMVQENVAAGVLNNVFGTNAAAQAAIQAGAALFVLISTDKAVRSTSVMGATKRVAETILQALAREPGIETTFLSVRFGNVLGSSGSVVPLFRQQIEHGGPVKVTHPDVTRYFMLIPEAAQLVVQAAAMARGGEVFVLDMGEPVKIVDLARSMIEISGSSVRDEDHPDGEIEINFVGLREGEKLFEELLIGENVSATAHELIMQCDEAYLPWRKLEAELDKLRKLLELGDIEGLKASVMRLAALPSIIEPAAASSGAQRRFLVGDDNSRELDQARASQVAHLL
jgi:UDP-N-acetylglucosamine 4,6-dehydratase